MTRYLDYHLSGTLPTLNLKWTIKKKYHYSQKSQIYNEEEKKKIVKNPSKVKKYSIYIGDCLFSAIVVGPMVVAHWRGIWALMENHETMWV